MKTVISTIGNFDSGLFDERELAKIIENQQSESAGAIKVDYETTMETWNNKIPVKIDSPGPWERIIYVDDDPKKPIYFWLDKGTKPHPIPRVPNIMTSYPLKFQKDYKSKTVSRKIYSGPGGPSGEFVRAWTVQHPGFPARDFSGIIQKKWDKEYPRQLQRAINALKTAP